MNGKVVIIAGGAGVQGRVAARLLADAGATVVLADLSAADLETAAAGIEGALAVPTDISDPDSWQTLVDRTLATFGRLDGLANFAAVLSRAGAETTELAVWERTLKINLTGAWLGVKAVIPAMRAGGGGSIVNVGSVDGLVGRGGGTAYQASKGGMRLLSKSAAIEFAAQGIRVNSVHPGPMKNRMTNVVGPKADASGIATLEAKLTAQVPMGRLGAAEDIAYAVRFLLSDEASFITGVDLPVDGGLTAQ
ncbi:SDR family NAD(P)-dependent oxidoreductase [Asanoa iriomotensis]|uniref:Short-chain dehydrogenase/reductase n=1 Tax=Asanoa iriomotensis TaxID=234613 RepID=A0ABQ4BYZ7_9ACTN|nr:SDR family oxidoreductase [Asanoa iriomotensis]GIF55732.1 putative short-chain dehydrogenase/reductase [Asanoa iriomotensis]